MAKAPKGTKATDEGLEITEPQTVANELGKAAKAFPKKDTSRTYVLVEQGTVKVWATRTYKEDIVGDPVNLLEEVRKNLIKNDHQNAATLQNAKWAELIFLS